MFSLASAILYQGELPSKLLCQKSHWKNVPLLQNSKTNVPLHANRSSFQFKWTIDAVKLCQLLFLFTQMMIMGQNMNKKA